MNSTSQAEMECVRDESFQSSSSIIEFVSLAANPQPFPPTLVVEAPEVQVQEFHASISQVTSLFTTYNKVDLCTLC